MSLGVQPKLTAKEIIFLVRIIGEFVVTKQIVKFQLDVSFMIKI